MSRFPRASQPDDRSVSDLDTLRSIPLLSSLSNEELARERHLFRKRAVAKHGYVFLEGDPPDRLVILLKGRIKLTRTSEGKDVILRLVEPGDWFGGVAAFGRRAHPYSAQALDPSVVMDIRGEDFALLMTRYPAMAQQVIEGLTEQLIEAHEMIRRLALEPVEPRLAYTLLQLAARGGGRVTPGVALPSITRQNLAELAGTTVETAIRILSKWKRAGLVREDNGRIVIADLAALDALARREIGE